jgi:CMP-N-acetylneuraminic acid synthetase
MRFNGMTLTWEHPSYAQHSRLSPAYYDCGAFMVFSVSRFRHYGTLNMPSVGGVVLPWSQYQDINTAEDLKRAKLKFWSDA